MWPTETISHSHQRADKVQTMLRGELKETLKKEGQKRRSRDGLLVYTFRPDEKYCCKGGQLKASRPQIKE